MSLNIQGAEEIKRRLTELPAKIEAKIMRGALRAGALVLQADAKAHVPVKSGALRDTIRVSTRLKGNTVSAKVTAGNRKKRVFYAHMVEGGTRPHEIKPKQKALRIGNLFAPRVQHPGARAKPFMRPALAASLTAAVSAIADYIRKRLDKVSQ